MTYPSPSGAVLASIIIPAHNEERSISRLLSGLLTNAPADELEIIVVCNGCSDKTAKVAGEFGPSVTVLEVPKPSKKLALKDGDQAATMFPRIYIDADVLVTIADVKCLTSELGSSNLLAVAPRRRFVRDGCSPFVRWYYDVWEALPQVKEGLFGRGVIGVTEEGHSRIAALPGVMSDDLVMSEAFGSSQRRVVDEAVVQIWPPKTSADLLRRRIRVTTGNAQADDAQLRDSSSKTSLVMLARAGRARPTLIPKMPVFLGFAIAAKVLARRRIKAGDFDSWLRDASSREE